MVHIIESVVLRLGSNSGSDFLQEVHEGDQVSLVLGGDHQDGGLDGTSILSLQERGVDEGVASVEGLVASYSQANLG